MVTQNSQLPVDKAITRNDPRLTIIILLIGVALLLVANGAFGTVLGVRANQLGFNTFLTGLVMSAYFAGYIVGSYYCLKAVVRVGHIRVFAALAALAAITALSHPLLPTPLAWGILRGIAGFSLVGLYIIIESWLNSQATAENRGKVFAIYMTVNLSAVAIGQFLLTIEDPSGFVVYSLIAILFALALLPLSITQVTAPAIHIVPNLSLKKLYEVSPVGVGACFVAGLVGGGIWGMSPVFAQSIGLKETEIATFMSALIIGGLLFQFPFGYYSDNHDRRRVILVAAVATAIVSASFFFLVGRSTTALIVAAFFFGGFYFPIYAVAIARVNDLLEPSQILGATRGLMLTYGIGAAIGPTIAGVVMNTLGSRAFFPYFAVTLIALAAFTIVRIRKREALDPTDQPNVRPITPVSPVAAEFEPRAAAEYDD